MIGDSMSKRTFSKEDTKIIGFTTDKDNGDRRLQGVYPLVFKTGNFVYTGCVTDEAVLEGVPFLRDPFLQSVRDGGIILLRSYWDVTTDAVAFGFEDLSFPWLDGEMPHQEVRSHPGYATVLELRKAHHVFHQVIQRTSEKNRVGLQQIFATLIVCDCLIEKSLPKMRVLAKVARNKLRTAESYEEMKSLAHRYAERFGLSLPVFE